MIGQTQQSFGKVVLGEKKRDHCIQDDDLEGY
jgi:hypothetical protein